MAGGAAAKTGFKTNAGRPLGKRSVVAACLQTAQPFFAGIQKTMGALPDAKRVKWGQKRAHFAFRYETACLDTIFLWKWPSFSIKFVS